MGLPDGGHLMSAMSTTTNHCGHGLTRINIDCVHNVHNVHNKTRIRKKGQ